MPRTLTAQVTIHTDGNLPVEEVQSLLDNLLAIGFADAQDTLEDDPDNERAAAACELELTCPDLVEGAYTVILLRPDDIATTYGEDSILIQVDGCTGPADAIKAAQRRAIEIDAQRLGDDGSDTPIEESLDDYFVIACFAGHHYDLNPGELSHA